MKADKSVQLLKKIRGDQPGNVVAGLKIVKVTTTEPGPITFVFEGTKLQIGLEIFEVPVGMYPLRKDDRLLAYPLIGNESGQRWAIVEKLTGGTVLATMASATSLTIPGIGKTYTAADLVIPPYFAVSNAYSHYTDYDSTDPPVVKDTSDDYLLKGDIRPLQAGDQVSIAPTWDTAANKIKYVILERY